MNSFRTRPPTAKQIDDACRAGFFVFHGNRQGLLGAVLRRKNDLPKPGYVWIHMASDLSWRYEPAASVTITTEIRKDHKAMPEGKRHGGRTPHLRSVARGSKKSASEPKAEGTSAPEPIQPDLPGVEQEKIPSLERMIKKYQAAKLARMEATKLEVATKQAVTKEMHAQIKPNPDDGKLVYKRPGKFAFKAVITPKGESLKVEEIDEDEDSLEVEDDSESEEE